MLRSSKLKQISSPQGQPWAAQIQSALQAQSARMEKAAQEEKQRKAERKRPSSSSTPETPDAKRFKLEQDASDAASAAFLSNFDFTTLPASLVTDLIVANLQAFPEQAFVDSVQAYRQGRANAISTPSSAAGPSVRLETPQSFNGMPIPTGPRAHSKSATPVPLSVEAEKVVTPVPRDVRESSDMRSMSRSPPGTPPPPVKEEEPVDPLQMDIDEEELEYEPDRLNQELSGEQEVATQDELVVDQEMEITLDLEDFKLPPPAELPEEAREALINGSLVRIWEGSKDLQVADLALDEAPGIAASDMWMLLLVRLVTRVVDPVALGKEKGAEEDMPVDDGALVSDIYSHQDRLRQTLCEYIMEDFSGRLVILDRGHGGNTEFIILGYDSPRHG